MFATSPFSGQSASVFINFGQQPFTYPVTGYEGLYQTWEQWARTTGYLRTASLTLKKHASRL